jgi:uncharacterized oxidoreductase
MGSPSIAIGTDALTGFVQTLFAKAGCPPDEATAIATHLVASNMAGHDSHGVVRAPRYIQSLNEGKVLAGRDVSVIAESPAHALLDGNWGFGQSIGEKAVGFGVRKARETGLALVSLRHTGHLGRIGDWAEMAAAAGLVSIHFVNALEGELVAPFGGVDRRFSTNPFCIGVPMPGGKPLILDFATSLVAEGKVLIASKGGKPVPPDAMIEPDGRLSGDPATLYGPLDGAQIPSYRNGKGALRAFGEHKGAGLAFMCDILAGCFTGGGNSGPVPAERKHIANNMVSIYLSPDHLAAESFARRARDFAEYVRSSRPAKPGRPVILPGEPEARARERARAEGLNVQAGVWNSLVAVADRLGVAIPAVQAAR